MALGIGGIMAGTTSLNAGALILAGILNGGLLSGVNGLIFAGLSTAAASTGIGLIVLGLVLVAAAAWYLNSSYRHKPSPAAQDSRRYSDAPSTPIRAKKLEGPPIADDDDLRPVPSMF